MNNHDEFKILISAYYDGEVSAQEKQQVEKHLAECAVCRKYLLELQTLSSSLKKWSDETPSPDLEQNINRFKKGAPMKPSILKVSQMAGSIIVVLILAVITAQTVTQRSIQARIKDASQYLSGQTQLALSKQGGSKNKIAYRMKSAADDIGDKYALGNRPVSKLQTTAQYEPYYLSTGYVTPRADKKIAASVASAPPQLALAQKSP